MMCFVWRREGRMEVAWQRSCQPGAIAAARVGQNVRSQRYRGRCADDLLCSVRYV